MDLIEIDIIRNLGLIVVTAAVFCLIGRAIRMPTIVVYIIAGLFLGPILNWVEIDHSLELISELGIALLLFLVGLELSLSKIRDVGSVALVAGIGQVVFTAAGGFVLCWFLEFTVMESLFLATALTFSSTVVVVKLLDQKGDLNKLYGRIAVGIFLVQDLVVIVVLTFLAGLSPGEGGGEPSTFTWNDSLLGLLKAFGGMGLILLVALLASRYVLPKPFAWAARSQDTIFIWALSWCFGIVFLAEILELSLEIGAFLAGLALAQLPYNEDLRRRLHPLTNFFIAIFFVSLGIQMDFANAREALPQSIVLALFVLIGNPLIFMVIIARMGYSERIAFQTSVTVAQISEFSFIFAAMGVSAGLIGEGVLSVVALVGVITIAVSAYMILYTEPLYRLLKWSRLLKIFCARQDAESEVEHRRTGHVIVVGMNTLGRSLVHALRARGETVLAVDTDPEKLSGLDCEPFLGSVDYESVIHEIDLPHARLVVSALQIEDTNHLLAYRCRSYEVPCAIHAFDVALVDELLDLDAAYLFMPTADGIIAQRNFIEQGVRTS